MRISKEEFRQKPFYVHQFLTDAPLHDVWRFKLRGGENKTLRDFRHLLVSEGAEGANPLVKILFRIRRSVGVLLGWDEKSEEMKAASYVHKLTDEVRKKTITEPGAQTIGPFDAVYEFENEALDEAVNATVHSFSLMAMESIDDGYHVYWAIYVKETGLLTPIYMAFIAPFRRFIVYPSIIKKLERKWIEQNSKAD